MVQGIRDMITFGSPKMNLAAALSTFLRLSKWYLGCHQEGVAVVRVRSHRCMEKSHGGLRVEEFLYLLNFM